MANKPANTEQKKLMSSISEWASQPKSLAMLYGDEWDMSPIQLHHVLGRSAKHNKVSIGHYFILPVPFALHDVSSNHPLNVTHRKKSFIEKFGSQSGLFQAMHSCMEMDGYEVPSIEVYNAIMRTGA